MGYMYIDKLKSVVIKGYSYVLVHEIMYVWQCVLFMEMHVFSWRCMFSHGNACFLMSASSLCVQVITERPKEQYEEEIL